MSAHSSRAEMMGEWFWRAERRQAPDQRLCFICLQLNSLSHTKDSCSPAGAGKSVTSVCEFVEMWTALFWTASEIACSIRTYPSGHGFNREWPLSGHCSLKTSQMRKRMVGINHLLIYLKQNRMGVIWKREVIWFEFFSTWLMARDSKYSSKRAQGACYICSRKSFISIMCLSAL